MDREDFRLNRERFSGELPEGSLAVLYSGKNILRSGDECYPFSVNRNFYYLTGIREPDVLLVMEKNDHGEIFETLYIPKADPELEKWVGKTITVQEAFDLSGIEKVDIYDRWWAVIAAKEIKTLYVDTEIPKYFQPVLNRLLAPLSGKYQRKSLSPILTKLRNIKQPGEIEAIKRAIDVTAKGISAITDALKPGVTERELELLFRYSTALAGGEGMSFSPIIASGTNAAVLHYHANKDTIKDGDLVLLDLGAEVACYSGDISRTLPCGKITDEQAAVYEAVLSVQHQLISEYQVGVPIKDIQEKTKSMLHEAAVERRLIHEDHDINEIYFHGVGHPLGLDVHDLGRQPDLVLAPGMVITCEPGLYFANKGIGVRIEDDILITEEGPINLSAFIPKYSC